MCPNVPGLQAGRYYVGTTLPLEAPLSTCTEVVASKSVEFGLTLQIARLDGDSPDVPNRLRDKVVSLHAVTRDKGLTDCQRHLGRGPVVELVRIGRKRAAWRRYLLRSGKAPSHCRRQWRQALSI